MRLALAGIVVGSSTLLLPAPKAEDSIVFAPADASMMRKSFDSTFELEMDDVTVTVGDEELPESATEAFTMSFSQVDTYVVIDEYKSVADGRTKELLRRFETLERHEVSRREFLGIDPEDEDETEESELVGHAVRFAWNDESGSFDVTWVGEAGEDELLEGLEEDMDLRAFLPPAPVSIDDTWELSGKALLDSMPPGGRLGFSGEDEDDEFDFAETFEGTAEATYAEMLEEDGLRLAVIEIELVGEAEFSRELNGSTQECFFAVDFDYELLWNLSDGHAHSIEVNGGVGAVFSHLSEIDPQGKALPLEIIMELGGTVEMSATFERE